jgi:hypothetical protein
MMRMFVLLICSWEGCWITVIVPHDLPRVQARRDMKAEIKKKEKCLPGRRRGGDDGEKKRRGKRFLLSVRCDTSDVLSKTWDEGVAGWRL